MRIAIIMAIYNPNIDFLIQQIESIRNQEYQNWTCFLAVDNLDQIPDISRILSADSRFQVIYGSNLGVYHNFERSLKIARQKDFDIYCFADQDDIWRPQKLSKIVGTFTKNEISLFHSDLETIDPNGNRIDDSVWKLEQRNPRLDFTSLLIRNSVTGCTMAISDSLAKASLPFPKQGTEVYWHHDLWIALLQSSIERKRMFSEPDALVLYRQHQNNVIGLQREVYYPRSLRQAVIDYRVRKSLSKALLDRLKLLQIKPRFSVIMATTILAPFLYTARLNVFRHEVRIAYRLHFSLLIGGVLSLISSGKIRFLHLAEKFKKKIFGTARTLVKSLITFYGHFFLSRKNSLVQNFSLQNLTFRKDDLGLPKILVLLPAIRESSFFGGASTVLKLALSIQKHLGIEIELHSIDARSDITPDRIQEFLPANWGVDLNKISIRNSDEGLDVASDDIILVSAWWNFKGIHKALKKIGFETKLIYLIQDFEPGFYSWSANYAEALSTYKFDSKVRYIFNSKPLADFFCSKIDANFASAPVLAPLIVGMDKRARLKAEQEPLRIFFYGRPSVPRNLFEMGVQSLSNFVNFCDEIELKVQIMMAGEDISSGLQSQLKESFEAISFLGKLSVGEYRELLDSCHIGLSLMLSPHPSYPPLEGAMSGMWMVTNSFDSKNENYFGDNLVLVEPDVSSIALGLEEALKRFNDGIIPDILLNSLGSVVEDVVEQILL